MPSKAKQLHAGPVGFTPYQTKKNEPYMNEAQHKHFEEILMLWKTQLMEEVDSTKMHMQNDAMNYADPVDRASLETDFSLELRTRDRERRLIKKIEQSLELICEGSYGYCEDCDTEIGIKRLEARPTATRCIDCKTLQEMKEKHE